MTYRLLTAAALCAALAVSACGKKEEAPAPDAAPPADAAAPAAADMAAPAAASGDATVPAECNAYLDQVAACTAKLSAANPAVAQAMQQSADQTRASWAAISDQAALAGACKQASDAFKASAAASGC